MGSRVCKGPEAGAWRVRWGRGETSAADGAVAGEEEERGDEDLGRGGDRDGLGFHSE